MPGVIITGPLGVGKTTIQRELVEDFGFWTPTTVTTRLLENEEKYMRSVSADEFSSGVVNGHLLLPIIFANAMYAFEFNDFQRINGNSAQDDVVVLNVRPYTALVISAFVPSLVPIWLKVPDDEELERRRLDRNAIRDNSSNGMLRNSQDHIDTTYSSFFKETVAVNSDATIKILRLLGKG